MRKPLIAGLSTVFLLGTVLTACGGTTETPAPSSAPAGQEQPAEAKEAESDKLETKFATVATGGASGPYNIIATSLTDIYSKTYGVNSKTQTTGASVENINLMKQEKVEMAFVMSDVLSDAVNGEGSFTEKVENVQQIAALYPNYVQVVTSGSTGIEKFEDLKGKRIAVGAQNSGVEVSARNLLEAHGITYNDIQVDYLGYAEAADGMKAGKIDAAFLTSGIPNASLMELAQSFDLKIVPIEGAAIEELAKTKNYFVTGTIPAGTYKNDADIPTAAIMNALVVRTDLSEDDVYKMTKTFFENLDSLANAHQAAKDISLEAAQKGLVAPLHPGAEKFYNEKK
ncbi:TAXI family TRAP transporter solute-binding subunit [Ammoniphilus sp. CFH 90114]|uniref:TAXI family TRAP transporter solute-binding subunit n=1 Tax=Ammoniphilus sp. CFH 90114 TaxID=2493665 RepID=UPI00100EBD08|nr:TAXI family TRAP transporter solute-binding subunit [Ammoniphilus sp. CFH 90114]RXT09093.1 TAXI family TRAP transporter solute-binding subunit [Ammoniphilus sp. CFH 90114]